MLILANIGNPTWNGINATITVTGSQTGASFDGWNTKADGSGTAYVNGESVINLSSTNGATVTLYAQWKHVHTASCYHKHDGSTTVYGAYFSSIQSVGTANEFFRDRNKRYYDTHQWTYTIPYDGYWYFQGGTGSPGMVYWDHDASIYRWC